ncbi:MAG: FtsX-like permease family protein, partial [Bacilli bacterium]
MGIIRLSLRSLKTDITRSFFYFCSFVLTTFFIFSFFNLTLNPATGIHLGKDDNTFVTTIAVLVIAVAMFCVFLANDFYVGHKNKELSVILMSGASVYRLGIFLFIQSFLIMGIAIPLGIGLGYFAIPFINILFQSTFLNTEHMFYFSSQTILVTSIILSCEVLWCTILNVGYCYRNSVFSV